MKLNSLANFTLMIGTAMLPVYIWSSGGVQVSHAILTLGGLFVLLRANLRFSTAEILLAALAATVFVRELVSAIGGANLRVLVFPLYVSFNFVLFASLIRWFRFPNAIRYFSIGIIAATVIAVMGVVFLGYASVYSLERAVGTFNNPNQLGYFAVCLFSISTLLYLNGRMRIAVLAGLVVSSLILAIMSLSKASMVSVFVPSLAIGFVLVRNKSLSFVGPLIAMVMIVGAYHVITSNVIENMTFVQRLSVLGSAPDDSLEGRGYTVILGASPRELLVGFGAEETSRIYGDGKDVHKMHEIHSTVFSFFVTYGLIGGLLFSLFMLLWAQRVFLFSGVIGLICIVGPPTAYGLSHNGSRFTMFWMLIAVSFAIGKEVSVGAPGKNTIRHGSFDDAYVLK